MSPFQRLTTAWIALFLWSACWAQSSSSLDQAVVKLGSTVLKLKSPAYRIDDACWAPAQAIYQLGWGRITLSPDKEFADVSILKRTITVPVRQFDGVNYIELREAVSKFGGLAEWDDQKQILIVQSRLTGVRLLPKGGVEVSAAIPAPLRVFHLGNPDRIVIDLLGTDLPETTPVVKPGGAIREVRIGCPQDGVARVVLETKSALKIRIPDGKPTARALITWSMDGAAPARIGKPTIDEEDGRITFRIPTSRRVNPRLKQMDGGKAISLDIRNATLDGDALEEKLDSPLASAIKLQAASAGKLVRLGLDLQRSLGVSVWAKANELTVTLTKPRKQKSLLAGLTIVVDPGHGGPDDGASTRSYKKRSGGGYYAEQEITLAIGSKLAEKLADAGAAVIMTRSESAYVELHERPKMANDAAADLFLSIHVNSNAHLNSNSGTYVYYHQGSKESALLADALQTEIGKVTGLPNHGILHDKTRFPVGGMAVLRLSTMPAVLIETAYLNNDTDRQKLIDSDWQETFADGIVAGLLRYLGEKDDDR